ncbi:probable basic-leucine zipper transcription factor Q [Armigeres subalbatus]|uniref:probable basic-leucine zipper transcription factor Q n=1 Tax=Armigeres subalbatus TaxID=124917 RepID=UPI002ED37CFA
MLTNIERGVINVTNNNRAYATEIKNKLSAFLDTPPPDDLIVEKAQQQSFQDSNERQKASEHLQQQQNQQSQQDVTNNAIMDLFAERRAKFSKLSKEAQAKKDRSSAGWRMLGKKGKGETINPYRAEPLIQKVQHQPENYQQSQSQQQQQQQPAQLSCSSESRLQMDIEHPPLLDPMRPPISSVAQIIRKPLPVETYCEHDGTPHRPQIAIHFLAPIGSLWITAHCGLSILVV